jgi:hypothetical protein
LTLGLSARHSDISLAPRSTVVAQFEPLHFVIPNRRSLPVRNLLLAGPKQIPRAIKLRFGMTNFSN